MQTKTPQFDVDEHGKRVGVIPRAEGDRRPLDVLEEREPIRASDAARAAADEVIPVDQAIVEE